jgi:DNA-binding beta-propeller fold protein YncE
MQRLTCFAIAALGCVTASAAAQVPGLTGTLIVTNKTPSTATVIDVASGRIVSTIPTGAGPHEVALSRDGRLAIVTDYSGQPGRTLTAIDVVAGRVLRTIDLGTYNRPHGIVFLPGDSLVAVTSEASGNLVVVNVFDGTISKAIATQGDGSHMVGVTANGALAYTGNMRSNTVSELDLRSGRFTRSWNVPTTPEAINVTPDGKEVWVGSNATGVVSVIDLASGRVTPVAEGVKWPYRVLYTPDVNTVLLPDLRGEELRFLDRASRRELSRLSFPGGGPQGITITPDGRYAFQSLSAQGRVAIIDMLTRAVVGHLAAGDTPDGIAYTTRVVAVGPMQAAGTVRPADVASMDAIVAALYDVISGPAGQKRDWDRFRALFAPGARLIPTGRRPDGSQTMRVLTPDEYAAQSGPGLERSGFFEREIGRRVEQFGGIAHVFSAYDSKRLPTDSVPFARGINSIQLMNDGKRWWVVTVFWDSERPANPLPASILRRP